MAFATRTTTYLSRVVPGTTGDVDAALGAVLKERQGTTTARGARLALALLATPPRPPGARYWVVRRYAGHLRPGHRSRNIPVELELTPWSEAACEIGLRHGGRRWPGDHYFDAADAVLDALAVDVQAGVAVERLAWFLRVVSGDAEVAPPVDAGV